MNRIKNAFSNGKAFIAFLTGGDPDYDTSLKAIRAAIEGGADLIEIGVPFSDPIAEGVVIQEADLRALAGGMTTDKIFDLAAEVRAQSEVAICLMTYLNPVFHYGYEKFFAKCAQAGVDGVIIPDMPYEEKEEAAVVARTHGVDVVSLIAPTSENRIRTIAGEAEGFLYVVSSMGVTGMRAEIKTDLESIMEVVRQVQKVPAAIGFGINTPEQAKKYAAISDGVIVGSAIVKIVEKYREEAPEHVYEYVKSMKDAIR
ncbi:MAG: tryptophan synthase subunit alpha [Lachnospiraceae bacterium]|nr:tryptophan synthase subunit alpha [Lachnospiraceae bacterium]